jgi:hypothetical protein
MTGSAVVSRRNKVIKYRNVFRRSTPAESSRTKCANSSCTGRELFAHNVHMQLRAARELFAHTVHIQLRAARAKSPHVTDSCWRAVRAQRPHTTERCSWVVRKFRCVRILVNILHSYSGSVGLYSLLGSLFGEVSRSSSDNPDKLLLQNCRRRDKWTHCPRSSVW